MGHYHDNGPSRRQLEAEGVAGFIPGRYAQTPGPREPLTTQLGPQRPVPGGVVVLGQTGQDQTCVSSLYPINLLKLLI